MKGTQIYNRPALKETRKVLRNNATPAELVLCQHLKGRRLSGKKFRRQFSVENYIIDFYCPAEKLGIELDGAYHFTGDGMEYDKERSELLNDYGIKIIRFTNSLVFEDVEKVLNEIKKNFF